MVQQHWKSQQLNYSDHMTCRSTLRYVSKGSQTIPYRNCTHMFIIVSFTIHNYFPKTNALNVQCYRVQSVMVTLL